MKTTITTAYVALGSNIEPERRLHQVATLLKAEFPDIRFSACYQNPAVGFEGEDFVNAVATFTFNGTLAALVGRLHDIEERCGRQRDDPKWAPRAMDLDVLLLGDQVCDSPAGRLPRADLARRAFMLGPTAELAPDLIHPTSSRRLADLWHELEPNAPPLTRVALNLNLVTTSPRSGHHPPPKSGR
jgi:2-amino-4-hydroxy-6-hydroxymethyldihydropteridine diphosphokinase